MSELTPCNRCSLTRMQRHARARGADVIVKAITDEADPMHGWTSARYSDEPEPTAWFWVLPDRCAC
jgi:hypothetical protein